jgi:hypothetical protein
LFVGQELSRCDYRCCCARQGHFPLSAGGLGAGCEQPKTGEEAPGSSQSIIPKKSHCSETWDNADRRGFFRKPNMSDRLHARVGLSATPPHLVDASMQLSKAPPTWPLAVCAALGSATSACRAHHKHPLGEKPYKWLVLAETGSRRSDTGGEPKCALPRFLWHVGEHPGLRKTLNILTSGRARCRHTRRGLTQTINRRVNWLRLTPF